MKRLDDSNFFKTSDSQNSIEFTRLAMNKMIWWFSYTWQWFKCDIKIINIYSQTDPLMKDKKKLSCWKGISSAMITHFHLRAHPDSFPDIKDCKKPSKFTKISKQKKKQLTGNSSVWERTKSLEIVQLKKQLQFLIRRLDDKMSTTKS